MPRREDLEQWTPKESIHPHLHIHTPPHIHPTINSAGVNTVYKRPSFRVFRGGTKTPEERHLLAETETPSDVSRRRSVPVSSVGSNDANGSCHYRRPHPFTHAQTQPPSVARYETSTRATHTPLGRGGESLRLGHPQHPTHRPDERRGALPDATQRRPIAPTRGVAPGEEATAAAAPPSAVAGAQAMAPNRLSSPLPPQCTAAAAAAAAGRRTFTACAPWTASRTSGRRSRRSSRS